MTKPVRVHFRVLLLLLALAMGSGSSFCQERDKESKGPKMGGKGSSERSLSQEEKERIRSVLAEAWKRPEVIAARDEVQAATETYKEALETAVLEIDPEAQSLMKRLHSESKMEAMKHRLPPHHRGGPGRGMGPKSPKDVVERIASSEPAFRDMNFEERRRFMDLAKAVHESGKIDTPMEKVMKAAAPKELGQARSRLREKLVEEMGKQDPWAAEKIEAAPPPSSEDSNRQRPSKPEERRKDAD